jgi:flavin-dependent dehydrogenase
MMQGNVLLLGDAANMVDPFIGEGIYYAIKGAKIASEAILNVGFANPAYIHRVIKEGMTPDLKAANKVAKFIYNFPDLCYEFFSLNPQLIERYFDVLKGESTYSAFYVKLKKNMHKAFAFLAKKGLSLSNKK